MREAKLNLMQKYKLYYTANPKPEIVEIEEGKFLTIKGRGAPEDQEFQQKIKAIYTIAYSIKKICKKEGKDFVVPKLEGLWWTTEGKPFSEVPRQEWRWKLLIRIPEYVTQEILEKAKQEVLKRKKMELVKGVKIEKIREGKCIQILHIGPYSTEQESLIKMRKLMEKENLVENGPHHEIYLSDPRKTPPEKLKTILRQPVKERNSD